MEALGPVLIVLCLPLVFRLVPPNRIYGFRVPAVYLNKRIWYDANALAGKHFIALGIAMVILEFLLPPGTRTPVLRVVGTVGLIGIMISDWIVVTRWTRQERRPSPNRSGPAAAPPDRSA